MRADFLEQAVWDDVRALLADPGGPEQEFHRRLAEAGASRGRAGRPVQHLLERV